MERPSSLNMKEEILGAAIRLFTRKGYVNTSMDDIAEAVGLTKGGLYHYVGKKEDLLTDIHDEFFDAFFARMSAAVESAANPQNKLRNWVRAHATIMRDYQGHIKVFFTEIDQLPEDTLKRMVERRDRVQGMLTEILAAGVEKGEIRGDVNPQITSFLILGMINWLYVWYRPEGAASIEAITGDILLLVLHGLSPAASADAEAPHPT
jgi:AcrR family transcriptional regulator